MKHDRDAPVATKEEACQSSETFSKWSEQLLLLEQEAEDEECRDLLVSCSHSELQARGMAILKLCVAEQTTALYGRACVTLEKPGSVPLPAHRITNGDIVGIFDQGSHPLSKAVPIVSAVVVRVRQTSIDLAIDGGEIPNEVLDGRQLNMATVSSDVTLKRYREALNLLKTGVPNGPTSELVRVCFGDGPGPRFREEKSELCSRPDAVDCKFRAEQSNQLNDPQQAAVVKALRAADVAIVHGPPGTGKTTTLVAYILEAVYRKQRLLVTAPSNVAVDNLLERVVDCGCRSVVRLGHPARVQSELHKFTMDNVLYDSDQASLCRDIKKEIDDILKKNRNKKGKDSSESKPARGELTELRKELRQRERRAVAEVLKQKQVIFATCAGAATLHREIRRGGVDAASSLEFDVVVIDEAAQALEVACWIPLLLGKKAVLAGDHQQLAATVKSSKAAQQGLDRTLFARLIERYGDEVAALLSIQYRMNEVIMGWSSRSFYDARLEAASSVASRTLQLTEVPAVNAVGDIVEAMKCPLLFVDTGGVTIYREDGQDQATSASKPGHHPAVHQSCSNPGESRFLVHYAKLLVKCGLSVRDLTVITPYNGQVQQLRNDFSVDQECEKLGLDQPRINTVDSFQGQEADAVLISLVRSNERGIVGFLSDYRRLNVAVTRARKHVMIVGDAATISGDNTLGSLYDYACERGKVLFVQQLLDEDGCVPADPAAAAAIQEEKRKKEARKLEKEKEKRHEKHQEEEKMKLRFESLLRPVLEKVGYLELPKTLNPYERAMAHEVAAALGLNHESRGEGIERQLCVWASGADCPEGHVASASKPDAKANAKAATLSPAQSCENEESGSDQETVLDAFERRARSLLASLGPQQPAAEWKAPSEEELLVLSRLAAEMGLRLDEEGSGKKRRCRVQVADLPAVDQQEVPSAKSAAASSSSMAAGGEQQGANSVLAGLHAERQRRQAAAAEERRKEIEKAESELKAAKKQGKKEKQAAKASKADAGDDDDLDAVLLELTSQDSTCAFGTCKAKINTLMDMVSKCKHCSKRFCVAHAQAEVHGCGDAAMRAERARWKDGCETAANPRGTALGSKSSAQPSRGALAGKLEAKVKAQEASRSAKKKDKK
eukprot:TRINITY_DN105506_c0_g1_i1.p1 TRINITY_DN105506_c0_g1~~TRINITY_DN105506_c0_g1_i1.p1  ORF type:complete len:1124 (-),score=248.83 TRINITY_DN105506_c0_g1_i1:317-3688(-)